MTRLSLRLLLISCILWISWLAMMLSHETGHVLGALATGGTVKEVVFHPTVMSRTEVAPNPHPLIEVWSGPIVGCLLPLALAAGVQVLRLRIAYLLWCLAGFCLIANGAYLGIGAIDPVGDARELITLGTSRWALLLFGIATAIPGLWLWHRISPQFGFGDAAVAPVVFHVWTCAALAALLTSLAFAFGNAG